MITYGIAQRSPSPASHGLAVELLLYRDMRHGRSWRSAVPVLNPRRNPDNVALANLLNRPSPLLNPALPLQLSPRPGAFSAAGTYRATISQSHGALFSPHFVLVSRGTTLTVAAPARSPIMGFRYGLLLYLAR